MSTFKSKAQMLKAHLTEEQTVENPHQIHIIKQCKQTHPKQQLSLQQPIIIEKKTIVKSQSQVMKKSKNIEAETFVRKKVQPWAPINIPPREKKVDLENISMNTAHTQGGNKEIEIQIEKDDKNKDCLKKLFKKIRKLQDDLKESQTERIRLSLQAENMKNKVRVCNDHDKAIAKLQAENYKLAVDLDLLKRLIKQREDQIQRLNLRAPKEVIKEIIVEKPVQVIVEVPKIIQGPERIVQKVVEVPKYIEVEKKVPVEVIKEVPREVVKTVTVEVPTIVEKPVYIDRPVYVPPVQKEKIVEVPVRVDVPYEVPVEYPVYIEKPVVEEQWLIKFRQMEEHLGYAMKDNALLGAENESLRIKVSQLAENLQMMRRHNEQKNREVQILLQNSIDYMPFSPNQHHQDYSMGSVKYSISSNPHPRII